MSSENIPAVLSALEKKVFSTHTVADTSKDLDKLYTEFMCSDNAESTHERQSATVSYQLIKKVLTAMANHQDPDDIFELKITFDF